MIEITENKASEMAEHAEKVLKHGGKLMQCIEELSEESRMAERGGYERYVNRSGRYGNRGGYGGGSYGNRYGEREDEWEDDDDDMGERRGRSSRTGRYMRR